MFQTGRRFANSSSAFRSPTFTLANPPPTGVVSGPFNATLLRAIDSSSVGGSVDPCFSMAEAPARCGSHSTSRPAVSRILTTALVISGPMPSPAISVMRCLAMSVSGQWAVGSGQGVAGTRGQARSLARFPIEEHERARDVEHHQARGQYVQRVEPRAPLVARRQPRRQAARRLLDGVNLAQDDEARIERDTEHGDDDDRAQAAVGGARTEHAHRA